MRTKNSIRDGRDEASSVGAATASTVREDAQHTPGPWVAQQHRGFNGASIIASNGFRVVSLPRAADRPYRTKEADARLIAAAPDLYAAAVNVLHALYGPLKCTHGNEDGDEDICDGCAYQREKAAGWVASELRAAINKAEGRP